MSLDRKELRRELRRRMHLCCGHHIDCNCLLCTAVYNCFNEGENQKHGFRIIGDEDALLETCGGESVEMESIGIYDDMPTACPRCGERLVLKIGNSY